MFSTRFFSHNRFSEIAIQLLVTFLLTMGLSSIVYFTIEFINARFLDKQVVLGVWLNNLTLATGIFCVAYIVYLLGNRLRAIWLRYLLLNVLTLLWSMVSSILIGILYWSHTVNLKRYDSTSWGFLYIFPPLIAVNFLYYWLTRERIRTMKITEQEYELLKVNELKTKAELEALQAKINPHFLYNSLNSIASLVHQDPDKAELMVLLLSKFFRHSTSVKNQYYDTVANELEMVKVYLDVEKVRFEDRLEYLIDIQDNRLRESKIPRFLIQPLVENAIKHGISKIGGKGILKISVLQVGDFLQIEIHDNGPAFPEQLNAGYGLQSIQDKLRLLCGETASIELANGNDKRVIIRIPYATKGPEMLKKAYN